MRLTCFGGPAWEAGALPVRGRRTNEDTFSVQLVSDAGELVTVVKADIKSMEAGKTSPMPSVARSTRDRLAPMNPAPPVTTTFIRAPLRVIGPTEQGRG